MNTNHLSQNPEPLAQRANLLQGQPYMDFFMVLHTISYACSMVKVYFIGTGNMDHCPNMTGDIPCACDAYSLSGNGICCNKSVLGCCISLYSAVHCRRKWGRAITGVHSLLCTCMHVRISGHQSDWLFIIPYDVSVMIS